MNPSHVKIHIADTMSEKMRMMSNHSQEPGIYSYATVVIAVSMPIVQHYLGALG